MWDTLGWGGETQALIYNPKTKKVIGINALGVAPTGATAEYYKSQGYNYPPEFGPLAAVTPGTPGGLMVMLTEFGTLSLAQVLAPAIAMADGYAIEAQAANAIERQKARDQEVEVLAGRLPAAPRRDARSTGGRRDLQAGGSRGDAAQARRGRSARRSRPASRARMRSRPPTIASTRATSRRRSSAASREDGGLFTTRRPREVAGQDRRAALDELQGRRRLQAARSGSRARCCCRRSTSSRRST